MRRRRLIAASLFASAILAAAAANSQQDFDSVDIHTLHVRGNVYMLVGAGGNITVQVGDQGVLVVDTMYAPLSEKVLAAIRAISDGPITWIINTHGHPDHVGGNAPISIAGSNIGGGNVNRAIGDSGANARIIAHENVLLDITGQDPAMPFAGWPTDTFFTPTKEIFFNGEAIQVMHQPNAHTDGDSLVFFRRTDVLSTGDLYVTTSYPFIDVQNGGTYQGIIDALNNILDIAIPADRQEGGTMIIPGHGRLSDEAEVVDYRDMLTIIRDRIQYMVDEGYSLRQVRAAEPTSDYDVRFGIDADFWSTERFIEAVYNELRASQ